MEYSIQIRYTVFVITAYLQQLESGRGKDTDYVLATPE